MTQLPGNLGKVHIVPNKCKEIIRTDIPMNEPKLPTEKLDPAVMKLARAPSATETASVRAVHRRIRGDRGCPGLALGS